MPTSGGIDDGSPRYSGTTGLIYIFNLIVGTGALTLPAAFHDAGWALGTAVIVALAFMSYLTTTFVIEAMAAANAMQNFKRAQRLKRSEGSLSESRSRYQSNNMNGANSGVDREREPLISSGGPGPDAQDGTTSDDEDPSGNLEGSHDAIDDDFECEAAGGGAVAIRSGSPSEYEVRSRHLSSESMYRSSSSYYRIDEIIEMGKMATLFFNKTGRTLFYLCLTIYLYGDLAIYGAAIAKSLRDVSCTYVPANHTKGNISETEPCWATGLKAGAVVAAGGMSRLDAYRVFLAGFTLVVGPFVFFNVTKTKYLQILTTIMRWAAFFCMVTIACVRLSAGKVASPPVANFGGIPNMFGVCVYSFMCHHSLPSLVTPISNKKWIGWLLSFDYIMILAFYLLLAFTGIFAFEELNDLYTLNFQPEADDPWYLLIIHYMLSLYPVITLSTNFPIIAITLRNNLKALFLTEGRMYSWCTRQCIFPLLALVPPISVALVTNSLEFLVGITGSYAGAGIQYVVPAFLVYFGRKVTHKTVGVGVKNQHESWFKSTAWIVFVQVWALGCVILVTWNHIATAS